MGFMTDQDTATLNAQLKAEMKAAASAKALRSTTEAAAEVAASPAMISFCTLTAEEQHASMCGYISRIIFGMIQMEPHEAIATGLELKDKFGYFFTAEPKLLGLIQDAIELANEPDDTETTDEDN